MPIDGLVTVAFVDVEGSTALIDRLGDSAGTAAVQGQIDRIRNLTADYNGFEVKSLGDGLLVTFTSPSQAVRWALACQRALAGTAPAVRIGINTGEAVSADGDPIGAAVNAASRITGRAAGGEVLVSDVVRQLTASTHGIDFHDRGKLKLKGFSDRWHLWAVSDDSSGTRQRVTLGRTFEQDVLTRLIADTAAGVGSAVLIEGEAGIGKSHLASLVADKARSAGLVLIEWTADEITRRAGALAHVMAGHPLLERADQRDLQDLLRSTDTHEDPGDRSFAIIEACIDTLENLRKRAPVLIIAEDLHWGDDLSLAVIRAITTRAGLSGAAMVATFRPTPRPTALDRLEELVGRHRGQHLRLGALDETDVYGLATALTGASPSALLRKCLDATAGNPLFVTEMIRSFDDEGRLRVGSGVADVVSPEIPGGLHATVRRRLASLPAETSAALRLASLVGTSFSLGEVAAVANRSVIDVAGDLREASQAGLIIGDGERLTFRHDVVRESVYASMLPAERRDLHRAAGAALARNQFPTQQIAWQFARGAVHGDVVAVEWLDRAGTEVLSIAPAAACDLFERALELAPSTWQGLGSMQARMIEPLAWCGRFDRASEIASAVLAASTDNDVQFAATRGMSSVYGNTGDITRSVQMLKKSATIPGAPADEVERELCMAAQLEAMTGVLDLDAARAIATRTLTAGVARRDATTQCLAYQALAAIDMVEGRNPEARAGLALSVALFDSGHVREASYLIPDSTLALSHIVLDEIEEGLRLVAKAQKREERRGAISQIPLLYTAAAGAYFYTGKWDDALTAIEAGRAVVDDTGNLNFILYFHALEARIRLRRGEIERANTELASGAARLAGGSLFGADWLMDSQVQLLVATAQPESALALAKAVWEQTAAIRQFFGVRDRVAHLTRLAVAQDDQQFAADVVATIELHAERTPVTSVRAVARQCRGLLDRDPGPILESVSLLRGSQFLPLFAEACEDAANLLTANGHREQRIALLREAATVADELGAKHDSERIARTLGTLNARPTHMRTARPTSGWDSLTDVEQRVSELATQGLTNPQIGGRLYISRRTVETHLAHVYRKLGLSGRAQLAAEFTRHANQPLSNGLET